MTYREIHKKFLMFSPREKGLVLLSGLFVILFGGYVWFIEPVQIEIDKLTRDVQRQKSELGQIDNQILQVEMDLKQDPDAPLQERLTFLNGTLGTVDVRLREQTVDLIPADKMPDVLQKVLSKSTKLKVLEMKSIPPVRMMDINSDTGEQVNLFQHGLLLVVEGDYFSIQNYLDQIEGLEWRFYWKRFDYLVQEHPVAKVEIELYTLSTSKAFIGV